MSSKIVSSIALGILVGLTTVAAAEPKVTVTPAAVHPGDPVLVTVTGVKSTPAGKAGGVTLQFFPSTGGFQAVFAVPLDAKAEPIAIAVEGAKLPGGVAVAARTFPETDVIVEDELANPAKPDRDRIDADNKAIIEATAQSKGDALFARPFRRPPGAVSSVFGEWRTFNDGHRSQHLGLDLLAQEGSKVRAIDAGTVVLVRETFLAGNIVVVAHGGGLASEYYHLSKTSVAEGDTVAQGAVIGLAGHTGRATGPHLHLSVRVPGGFVDPAAFFKLPLRPARPTTAGY